jgi:hypothetical protein
MVDVLHTHTHIYIFIYLIQNNETFCNCLMWGWEEDGG